MIFVVKLPFSLLDPGFKSQKSPMPNMPKAARQNNRWTPRIRITGRSSSPSISWLLSPSPRWVFSPMRNWKNDDDSIKRRFPPFLSRLPSGAMPSPPFPTPTWRPESPESCKRRWGAIRPVLYNSRNILQRNQRLGRLPMRTPGLPLKAVRTAPRW